MRLLFTIVIMYLLSCAGKKNGEIVTPEDLKGPVLDSLLTVDTSFDVNKPENILILPRELTEISGLGIDNITGELLTVNDEKGFLYRLDKTNGKIKSKNQFSKDGDYEGIEMIDDNIYIIKSNGDIYIVDNAQKNEVRKIKTALSSTNDVEGLGYSPEDHTLVIACKGSPALSDHSKHKKEKAFYKFDLTKQVLIAEPFMVISDEDLRLWLEQSSLSDNLSKSKFKDLERRLEKFSPSGIAWHSISKQYYILSSTGKLMVMTDSSGKIKDIEFLDSDIHQQPEGIVFSRNNELYISNEGRGLSAKIFSFGSK